MKIALIGYGKMGKTIEHLAITKGHEIVARIDFKDELTKTLLKKADVAIEFTQPESAAVNLIKCFDAGVPVVCGTTGWLKEFEAVVSKCKEHDAAFFYASNYSLGVNIFFEINKRLAGIMDNYPQYDVRISETHHTQKLDAPSGTAISLANDIFKNIERKKQWVCNAPSSKNDLLIEAKRIDPAPGTHVVQYISDVDTIEISHTAHSRIGFASGALIAAEWLVGKKGVYNMNDLLGFS